jgi:Family of unknown function (DUF6644)
MLMVMMRWLQNTAVGNAVHNSTWLFPTIETVHLFGIVALVGASYLLDFRLLGIIFRDQPIARLARRLLPWVWGAFGLMVLTGGLLFSSEAVDRYQNSAFRLKMLLILLAGVNAFFFQAVESRTVEEWGNDPRQTPLGAKLIGAFSILLWFGVLACGRWIAYS